MNANNFVPEIWAREIKLANKATLVTGLGIVNHDYEGEVAKAGDTVHINGLEPVTIKDYDRAAGLGAPQQLGTNRTTLTITEEKSFDFIVDDIDKAQSNVAYIGTASAEASFGLTEVQDDFTLNLMVAGAQASNKFAASLVEGAEKDFYNKVLVPLRTKLNKAKVPAVGRFVVIDVDSEALLTLDPRFIANGSEASDARLLTGEIGRAAGFRILMSTSSKVAGKAVAGVQSATTVADQIVKTRGMESENWFGTRVSGLHVYGAKVVRPENLAVATITVAPAA